MANTILTNDVIAKVALASFVNELSLVHTANTGYESESVVGRGDTLRIDQAQRFTVRSGSTQSLQDFTQKKKDLTLDQVRGIDLEFSSKELTLDIRRFTEQVIQPQMRYLANSVDLYGYQQARDQIYHTVGTAGTPVNSFSTFNKGRAFLRKVGVDYARYFSMNNTDGASLQDSLQNNFNSMLNKNISETKGLGSLGGLDVYVDPNMDEPHTVGTHAGTPLVNGAAQTGASLVTDGWTSTSLKKGDRFTIAGVYAVNPLNQAAVGAGTQDLQVFTVTADVSDTAGDMTIGISPAIDATTAYKTVDAVPADNAAITVIGATDSTFTNNFMYAKDAFCFRCVELIEPRGAAWAKTMTDPDTGVSIRFVETYDGVNDKCVLRSDILFGWLINPEYAVNVIG